MATILDYSNKFEKYLRLRNNAQNTIEVYTGIMKLWLAHFKKDPQSITPDMIGDYILTMKSSSMMRQVYYTLNNFYDNVMLKKDYLANIPVAKREKYLPETFNQLEVIRLVNATANIKHRAILQLIYSCALRIGEAVNLKLSDIDGQRKQIHIKLSKGAKDRIIPIPEDTLVLLRNYYVQYKPQIYLFEGQFGGQYTVRSIQQVFHQAKAKAKIYKKVTVHSLRHSRATHLLCNGVDIKFIADMLGHSNIKTTTDFYIHTDITDLQQAIQRADTLFSMQGNLLAA